MFKRDNTTSITCNLAHNSSYKDTGIIKKKKLGNRRLRYKTEVQFLVLLTPE